MTPTKKPTKKETKFKYLELEKLDKFTGLSDRDIQIEIAYQLKRIADKI